MTLEHLAGDLGVYRVDIIKQARREEAAYLKDKPCKNEYGD